MITEQVIIAVITATSTISVAVITAIRKGNEKLEKKIDKITGIMNVMGSNVEANASNIKLLKKSSLQANIFRLINEAYRNKKISENNLAELYKDFDEYKANGWNSHTNIRVKCFEEDVKKGCIKREEKN
ncbi:homoserine O-succinyltransferase [Enterococcus termitis]|uniref:Uncharacterized protein n=1 Tax=Enterococcus termitis TaxID=332950 RepID=A0A1E5H0J9_9ENTE|nr:homoserine O-succinyltransferase [Enterococcus termitis]OEG18150.1 hypothetical protein BCR25_16790 [Enterococcus termitis]